MSLIHASCVAINGHGVLILGKSGSGKSDLALRLIDEGALLVADDQVEIEKRGDALIASAPDALKTMLEVYGIGLLQGMPTQDQATLALAVQLVEPRLVERLPPPDQFTLDGASVLQINLSPFNISATAKIRAVLSGSLLPQDRILCPHAKK